MKKIFLIIVFLVNGGLLYAQNWRQLGTGLYELNSAGVTAIVTDTGGIVYAAGDFTNATGKFYIAKWNGTSWAELGTGADSLFYSTSGGISTLCLYNHTLYASGTITDSNGKYYVAKWDGSSWSELGTGINALNANSYINSICTDNFGNIYAAGSFTDSLSIADGNYYVAKWNGSTWSELGTNSNALNAIGDELQSVIADSSGNIYVTGYASLSSIPGSYYSVAKWNGVSWNELGIGGTALNANGPVWTLCTDAMGNIYAGGFFTDPSGKNYVAKWNGSVWNELGTGSGALNANAQIYSVNLDSRGNVYAGGAFTDSPSNASGNAYIAEYTPLPTNVPFINNYNNLIKVYPTPSENFLFIDCSDNVAEVPYVIVDAVGATILSGKLESKKTLVDISTIMPGIYYLYFEGSSYCTYKIIKN